MLLRPAVAGFEVYMLRRNARSAFAPDAYVFPGGVIDEGDSSPLARERVAGIETVGFRGAAGADDAVALCVGALRELFEEAGVLLVDSPVDAAVLDAARRRLRSGEMSFAHALLDLDRHADAGALTFFSRWITPPNESRRYDTFFFVARMPEHQTPAADSDETHDGRWIAPGDALAECARGALHLVYPTIKHLERLAAFDDLGAFVAFAHAKPVIPVAPYTSPQNGFRMPPELEGAW